MSVELRSFNTPSSYQRHTHFGSVVQQTSSVVINFQKLQEDLQTQYQHDKQTLSELNQRFQLFLDRIELLQTQNSEYINAIANLRRQLSSVGVSTDVEENFFSLKSNLLSNQDVIIDHEWYSELFQLQIAIYKNLLGIENQSKDNRIVQLENELKQTSATLNTLRSSYEQTQRQLTISYSEGDQLLKQYLALTEDWCNIKKQKNKSDLNLQTLRSYISFYKNIRSYAGQGSFDLATQSVDSTEYWRAELESIVKRIRRDFEVFYGKIQNEMVSYYETKTNELEGNVRQAFEYQQNELQQWTVVEEKLKIEYQRIELSLTSEREILVKLESAYSKLEGEYQLIDTQNAQLFESQTSELQALQEEIFAMAYDVEEIRRSKNSLEAEIIIYRQLLGISELETSNNVVIRHTQPVVTESSGRFVLKRKRKGPIHIKECAPDGSYISLINTWNDRYVDISRWTITRQIDSITNLRYIIPDGTRLDPGRELRIYAKSNNSRRDSVDQSNGSIIKLINNNINSWGDGNTIETFLFNEDGGEEASFFQTISSQRL